MSDEKPGMDYLERAETLSRHLGNEGASAKEIAAAFVLYGPEKRAAALYGFDEEMSKGGSQTDLRRVAELHGLRRQMGLVHERLQKAGR